MRQLALAVLALLVVALPPVLAGDAKAKRVTCTPRGSTTVQKTKRIRVYTTSSSDAYVACVRPHGPRRVMDEPDGVYSNVGEVAVAGDFVAWTYSEVPACKADCPPNVNATSRVSIMKPRTGQRHDFDAVPDKLWLAANGHVAWLQRSSDGYEVHASERGAPGIVNHGAIDPASFAFDGTTLTWTNAGQPQSLKLGD
jgi:hypothetical protein